MTERQLSNLSSSKHKKQGSVFDRQTKQNLVLLENRSDGFQLLHDVNKNSKLEALPVKVHKFELEDTL